MTFAVMLMPTTASANPAVVEERVVSSVAADTAGPHPDGAYRTSDGGAFHLSEGTFYLTALSPQICKAVFDAALATNSYVATGGWDATPLTVKGAAGQTPTDLPKAPLAGSAQALCVVLERRLRAWNRFVREGQRDGTLGQDEQPLEPPAEPGAEYRIIALPSGIAADCQRVVQQDVQALHWKLERVVISQNTTWGIVWRADVSVGPGSKDAWRFVCWQKSGRRSGLMISSRPLTMFDPKQSIGPLMVQP